MRNVNIRMLFPPYVDQVSNIGITNGDPSKTNILRMLKKCSELDRDINKYHAMYLMISDMDEWLVAPERFSVSHTIGEAHVFIQVEKQNN